MAYCSYCAAVLEPGQPTCVKCGNASGMAAVASAPVPVAVSPDRPAFSTDRPSNVRLGAGLLMISWAISVLSLASVVLTPAMLSRLPVSFFARSIGLSILFIVLVICIWQRQGWARIALALLLIWSIGTLLMNMMRMAGSPSYMFSLAVPLLIDILRGGALYLLFTTESNSWFKKPIA